MSVLVTLVIAAEILAGLWFLTFLGLAHRFEREGRIYPQTPRDPVGRVLIVSVRLAFVTALVTLAVISTFGLT